MNHGGWINIYKDANLYVGDNAIAAKLINNSYIKIDDSSLITAMKHANLSGIGAVDGLGNLQNNGAILGGCWGPQPEPLHSEKQ